MHRWEYCKAARSMHGGFFIETARLERVNVDVERFMELLQLLGKDGWKLIDPHKDENGFYFFTRLLEEFPDTGENE